MANNEAQFRISLEGDSSNVGALFAAFKRQLKSDVSEMERITSNLQLFKGLDDDLKKAAAQVDKTRLSLATLQRATEAVKSSGDSVGKELAKSLTDAERAAARAEKEFIKQSIAVDKLRTTLKGAGVDLSKVAAEEERLALATKQATAAAVEQQSKTALGFRTLRDIAPEVNRLTAAYTSLRDSGKLSFSELSTLQARYQQQVANLRREVGGIGTALTEVRGTLLAFTAAFAGVIAAGAKSAENFREFSTQITAIGSIAGVSDAKLAELADGVRRLSREMGVDAVNSAKALYDIIGSGIPADNAISVLAEATKAARAGLTDVHTAAAVGVAVLNGYGLQVNQLEHVYDVLFQTVKDGVVSFPELAKNIGTVIPIARQANIPLEELGAAFVVLTRQGIDAPEAATAIARAIQNFSAPAPAAADKMRELGIEFRGLVGTVEQFSKLNLSPDQIAALIPETRAVRAVAALSQNFALLRETVESTARASGAMQEAYVRMAATPQARIDRFNASLKDLSFTVGEFVTNSSGFVEAITRLVNAFNDLGPKTRQTAIELTAFVVAVTSLGLLLRTLAPAINLLVAAMTRFGAASITMATGFTGATAVLGLFSAGVGAIVGFRLGELFYEWLTPVRRFGDQVGLTAALISNTLGSALTALSNILARNVSGLRATYEQFRANNQIIAEQYVATLTGATERSRALTEAQTALGEQLAKTAKKAGEAATGLNDSVTKLLTQLDTQAKAVQTALTTTNAKLTSLLASLQKAVSDTTGAASTAIANLAASTATRLAALSAVDVERVQQTVVIQREAAKERLNILNKFATDVIRAFDAEADARRNIAIKSGEDLKRVDIEIAQAKRAVLQTIVDQYRAHVDALLTIEKQHLENIRQIEEQRRGINQSVEEKIRDIRRGTLDAYQQYADRVREIDGFISKSRQALAAGDNKLAEEFANKAIAAAGSVAAAVKDGEREVVSASRAQSSAISQIQQAQDLLNKSLKERAEAERTGADAAKKALSETLPILDEYKRKLDAITETARQGIDLKLTADVEAVTKAVDDLAKQLAEREILIKLTTDLTQANEAIQRVKEQLEKGIPVPLVAQTEAMDAAIQAIRDAKPELQVETAAAAAKVGELRAAVTALEAVKVEIQATVNSNVAEVQSAIDELKRPTFSTHTVTIVTQEAKAGGGMVGEMRAKVRRFARGGDVFNRPRWTKVPGFGNGDTVPAGLQEGSFVVRKPAARYYGDRLMSAIARGGVQRFASGGGVLTPGKGAGAILLGRSRGSALSSFDDEFREILDMLFRLREESQLLPKSSTGLDISEWAARIISRFPLLDDRKKQRIKGVVEDGFEGWLNAIEAARRFRVPAVMEAGIAALAFRKGGGGPGLGTDIVPAMLTPGEFVVRKPAVDRFGSGLLHAINDMRISRESLSSMLAPPDRVHRYSEGGQVGGTVVATPSGGGALAGVTINLQASAADILTERNIRNMIVPVLKDIQRGSG